MSMDRQSNRLSMDRQSNRCLWLDNLIDVYEYTKCRCQERGRRADLW